MIFYRESRTQTTARMWLGLALLGLGVYTLLGFLPALVWGSVFVMALWPMFLYAQRKCGKGHNSWILPILFTLCVGLVFIIPITLAGIEAGQEVGQGLAWVHAAERNGLPQPDWVQHLPATAAPLKNWWQHNLSTPEGVHQWSGKMFQEDRVARLSHLGTMVVHKLVLFGFTLLTALFLFRYGFDVAAQVNLVAQRIFGPRGQHISQQILYSVRGTVSGLVLVGLGEGFILGIAYAIAGVPHAVLFGTFTAAASMIPFGAPLAYGLASLLLLAQGSIGWAIGVFIFGSIVLFVADHFVRPGLIGNATRMPFIWVLLGILGGVESWGLLGLFIGPAILAALILLWRELADPDSDIMPDSTECPEKQCVEKHC